MVERVSCVYGLMPVYQYSVRISVLRWSAGGIPGAGKSHLRFHHRPLCCLPFASCTGKDTVTFQPSGNLIHAESF